MKACPFCAEHIQDAAIKCRYCGSMLEESAPSEGIAPWTPSNPAGVQLPQSAVSGDGAEAALLRSEVEPLRALMRRGKKIDAIKLAREQHPDLGLKEAKEFVEGLALDADVAPQTHIDEFARLTRASSVARVSRPWSGLKILGFTSAWLIIGTCVFVMAGLIYQEQQRQSANATASPAKESAPSPVAPATATGPAGDREGIRAAIDNTVKLGLIRRIDLTAGKFYINGELWEGFEFDQKETIVKAMSLHRHHEFGLPQVTLLESRSGKELASYGVFGGVSIR